MAFAATPPYDGTLARYYRVPADLAYELPENLTFEDGAMVRGPFRDFESKLKSTSINRSNLSRSEFTPFQLSLRSAPTKLLPSSVLVQSACSVWPLLKPLELVA